MQTITRLFDHHADAMRAVRELEGRNVDDRDISMVAHNAEGWRDEGGETDRNREDRDAGNDAGQVAATGAGVGAVLGGGAGLLTGLGLLAIPGLGPVVAAGWLATTALGAVGGAAVGGGGYARERADAG